MKFSVLMSVYIKEQPDYLQQCLESIWTNQSKRPDEIVVVKDGPLTQQLDNIIDAWKTELGNNLKIVALPNNVGLGKALNEGLNKCSNEWVFRMDTDDICLPDRFEKQINYINQHPNIVLLGGQIEEYDEKMENILGKRIVPINQDDIKTFSIYRNPFNHMTVAYKKSIVLELNGYQHHLYMEDYNLWLRIIAQEYQIHNLPDILIKVRSGKSMYERRKGINYIKSELVLAQLKEQLGLQSFLTSYGYFIIRSLTRLLPTSLIGKVYKTLRK